MMGACGNAWGEGVSAGRIALVYARYSGDNDPHAPPMRVPCYLSPCGRGGGWMLRLDGDGKLQPPHSPLQPS